MAVIEVKNPVLKSGAHYVTSDYKTRNPKRSGKNGTRAHNGMDFVARKGNYNTTEYIVAVDDGTVYATGYGASAGYYVKVKHANGYLSLYYHLKKGSIAVKKGAKVVKGQILGYMGSTGNSTGAHLHFGIYTGKEYVDPKPYLQGKATFAVEKIDVEYQVHDNVKNKWLNVITNYNNEDSMGYAGNTGNGIDAIRARLSKGTITICSHVKGGKWCSEITQWNDTSKGYSGVMGKDIDKVMIKTDVGKVKYRVHTVKGRWLNWITDYNKNKSTGYAGNTGESIDRIQIVVE